MDPASPLDQLASTSRKESIRRRKGAAQLSSKHERWEHGNSEGMAREDSGMGRSNEMRGEEWPATSDRAVDPAAYDEGDEIGGNDARSQVGDRASCYSEDYTKELAEGDDQFHHDASLSVPHYTLHWH